MPSVIASRVRYLEQLTGAKLESFVEGPVLDRACMSDATSLIWVELPKPGGPFDPLERRLPSLREAQETQSGADWLCFPDLKLLVSDNVGVFRLPPSETLYHRLAAGGKWPSLEAFTFLGTRLAEFHRAGTSVGAAQPASQRRPVVRAMDQLDSEEVKDCHLHLIDALGTTQMLLSLANEGEARMASETATMLHGRWSLGTTLLRPEGSATCTVLGGIDCWFGPREFDVGFLIGELLEMAAHGAVGGDSESRQFAFAAAEAFAGGYQAVDRLSAEQILVFSAHRLVTHLVLNAWWRAIYGIPQPAADDWKHMLDVMEIQLVELLGWMKHLRTD